MIRRSLTTLLLPLFLFSACDDPATPGDLCPGGDPDAQLAILDEAFCRPMAEEACDAALTCGCPDVLAGFPDRPACVTAWRDRCVGRLAEWREDLASGAVRTCPQAAARCVEAYRPLLRGCLREMPAETLPAGCVQLFSVDTRPGQVCPLPGIGCDGGRGICSPFDGKCTAGVPGADEPCEGVCEDGLVCGNGGRCVPGATGDACDDRRDCRTSLACVGGTCLEPLPVDGACGEDTECLPGLRCADETCAAPPAACDGPAACGQNAACLASSARLCVLRTGLGEPCDGDDCATGAWCDGGTCAALPGDPEPCADGVRCAPGLACGTISGLCAPLPGDGEPCAMNEQGPFVCADGLACLGDLCGSLPGQGEPCGSGDHSCAEGLGCAFNTDGTSTCEPQVGPGEPCSNDRQCLAGTYCEYALNLCATYVPAGAPCDDGNECGPDGSCVDAGAGGAFVCVPMPGLGEPCALECVAEAVCRFTTDFGACVPPVCAEIPF
jgi:hypothetical protein